MTDLLPDVPANAVALTFDDGPDPSWTPRVLDLLARYQIPATFFMMGRTTKAYPDLARRALAAGHCVGNHTYSHPLPFTGLSPDRLNAEIGDTQSIITAVTGRAPRLFRAPGGEWDSAVLSAVAAHALIPVGWDVDPRDWSRPGAGTIAQRLRAARPGDILLCHDGGGDRSQTVAALEEALPELLSRGYRFVALDPAT